MLKQLDNVLRLVDYLLRTARSSQKTRACYLIVNSSYIFPVVNVVNWTLICAQSKKQRQIYMSKYILRQAAFNVRCVPETLISKLNITSPAIG